MGKNSVQSPKDRLKKSIERMRLHRTMVETLTAKGVNIPDIVICRE